MFLLWLGRSPIYTTVPIPNHLDLPHLKAPSVRCCLFQEDSSVTVPICSCLPNYESLALGHKAVLNNTCCITSLPLNIPLKLSKIRILTLTSKPCLEAVFWPLHSSTLQSLSTFPGCLRVCGPHVYTGKVCLHYLFVTLTIASSTMSTTVPGPY